MFRDIVQDIGDRIPLFQRVERGKIQLGAGFFFDPQRQMKKTEGIQQPRADQGRVVPRFAVGFLIPLFQQENQFLPLGRIAARQRNSFRVSTGSRGVHFCATSERFTFPRDVRGISSSRYQR